MKRFAMVAAVALLALTGCASEAPPVSDQVQSYYNEHSTPAPVTKAPSLPPLNIHDGSRVLFFGDSWTFGTSAEPVTAGYAYRTAELMHLEAKVDGVGGTGYVNRGPKDSGNYAERLERFNGFDPEVVILQGSINDLGQQQSVYVPAVNGTIKAFRERFPNAQLVVLGPAPSTAPTQSPNVGAEDIVLANAASAANAYYISPWREGWISSANVGQIIDPATKHPSTAGHDQLAQKLVASLGKLVKP